VTALAPRPAAPVPQQSTFRHEAFLHRGEDEFADGVLAFVREGLAEGDAVLVAEPPHRLDRLRDGLGDAADEVRWLDMSRVGANPGRLLGMWATALAESRAAGRRLRGVGEPAWPGRRPQELAECHVHELLLNRAFADGPGWRLMCPYDERLGPTGALDAAARSHPEWSSLVARGRTGAAAGGALEAELTAACAAPLPAPAGGVLTGRFGADDVPAVRHTVASWARSCRLPVDQVELLELAASELACNAVRHGGGRGTVGLWEEAGAAVLEVRDSGPGCDPGAGRQPPPGPDDPAGLHLLHQLCDLLQLRTSPAGTTVRVTVWR
jgi:anti-sigma regulatory factor (Ser/Thr protein kinase)